MCSYVCVPVLTVLPIVVVSTVTDVSMGRAGFPVALGLVFTRIQVAGVSAAFPVVTWARELESKELISQCFRYLMAG